MEKLPSEVVTTRTHDFREPVHVGSPLGMGGLVCWVFIIFLTEYAFFKRNHNLAD